MLCKPGEAYSNRAESHSQCVMSDKNKKQKGNKGHRNKEEVVRMTIK